MYEHKCWQTIAANGYITKSPAVSNIVTYLSGNVIFGEESIEFIVTFSELHKMIKDKTSDDKKNDDAYQYSQSSSDPSALTPCFLHAENYGKLQFAFILLCNFNLSRTYCCNKLG